MVPGRVARLSVSAALLGAALVLGGCAAKEAPAPSRAIDFKAELSRHGEWIVMRPHGRVWHPNESVVGEGFIPYATGGQWRPTPDGWEFESQWGWGEFTFHRGRWLQGETGMGWVWVPDQERATSWVDWRVGPDWVAWTPVAPIAANTRKPEPWERPWSVVRTRVFTQPDIHTHLQNQEGVMKALNLTTELPAAQARFGPDFELVRNGGGLTADGGVPDLTPPPDPNPPPPPAVEDEQPPPEEEKPPPKKKKSKKKGKKGK
jgi:hypothetical protein